MAAVDQVRALTEAGVVERASRLAPVPARLLPVPEAFEALLGEPGLRRGTTVRVGGVGATSLSLALASRASSESWVAAVGTASIGLVWASELGVSLDRFVIAPDPGRQWLGVVAALVDAFDVVVAHPPRLRERDARKVAARVREQRSVLIAVGGWPGADLQLETTSSRWCGIGGGHGHLAARMLTVRSAGRGAASLGRETTLWLPDEHGRVTLCSDQKVVLLPV